MAVYPNRGIIDGAFAVVHDGVQRSVFASGRIPEDRSQTRIGPLTIDVVEPLRVTRVRVDAADLGIDADVTFTGAHGRARRAAPDDERRHQARDGLDAAHAMGHVVGAHQLRPGREIPIDAVYGTKDRSWGVRPVGEPRRPRPTGTLPQIFFLWAPINWDDCCTHFLCFERANGDRFVGSQAVLDLIGAGEPAWGVEATERKIEHLAGTRCTGAVGAGATAFAGRDAAACCVTTAARRRIELEPLLTFRMRGLGYTHPEWGHGHWHGEEAVGSEEHKVEELDNVEPWNIHIQQVMRARWGDTVGLGVLEQLAFGEHRPSGLTGILDGFAG